MPNIDALENKWADRTRSAAVRLGPEFTTDSLVLGGTRLATLALDGEEDRILALLSVARGSAVPAAIIGKLRKACDCWSRGEKSLAHIHLRQAALPPLADHEQAFALFAAGELLDAGFSPRALMRALDLDPAPLEDLRKYAPDQPRVPAGSGRESGRWTSGGGGAPQLVSVGGGGATQPASEGRLPRNARVKPIVPQVAGGRVSDANPDSILPGAQYAQASPTPVLTAKTIDHILKIHGPGAKDRKGGFYPEFANSESVKWLVEGAWEKAIPIHVYAGDKIDRVVISARAYLEDDTGKHRLNIGRSGRGLQSPSIETDTYVVVLDSNNNVITCYPINPADVIYPYEE